MQGGVNPTIINNFMNNKILVSSLVIGAFVIGATSIALAATSNYQGFRSAMGDRAPKVTEQNFDRYTQMQKMMVDGDYAGAQKVRTELGLGQGQGNGGGCQMKNKTGNGGGCSKANGARTGAAHTGFVDKNNNGICDTQENLK